MLALRRFAILALLTGLLAGCKAKSKPAEAPVTAEEHKAKKFKMVNDAPQGPKLRQ
jgi:hypothetical protein